MVEVQLKQDAYMEVGGRQCLEHIVEQLSAKTDRFPCASLNSKNRA